MSSSVFLTMCIDPQLKTELREQARGEGCDLTEYVARELLRSLPASTKSRRNQAAARKPRLAHLAILVGSDLKAKLEMQAAAEYRTFANFVEIQLQEIVDFYRENPIRPPCAVERRRHLRPDWQPRRGRVATSLSVELKAQLKKLADEDHRELGNFIEVELDHVAATRRKSARNIMIERRRRSARLVMRVSAEFNTRLQRLANNENRSLTDFVEIRLHKIAARQRR